MPSTVKEVKWGQDNDVDVVPTLSEEEKHSLKQRMAKLDLLLAEKKTAKYKIEIFFSEKRTGRGHYPGILSIWESGNRLHGGGDTKMYECPGKALGRSSCTGFIPDASNGYGFLVCPRCQVVWKGEDVIGERLARLNSRGWAELVLQFYVRLDHNADIYLKYPREDLRVAAKREQEKQWMGEKLSKVRGRRVRYIYPLNRIVKDCSAGADILGRFYAFLTA